MDIKHISKLERYLSDFNLPRSDLCLVGSASLAANSIRMNNDLDICVTGEEWEKINNKDLPDGVEFDQNRYLPLGLSNEDIINKKRFHDHKRGFKIVRPEICFSYKQYKKNSKSKIDLELLNSYIKKSKSWDWDLYIEKSKESQKFRDYSFVSKLKEILKKEGPIETILIGLNKYTPLHREKLNRWYDFSYNSYRSRLGDINVSHYGILMNNQYDMQGFNSYDLVLEYIYKSEEHSLSSDEFVYKTQRNDCDIDMVMLDRNGYIINPSGYINLLTQRSQVYPIGSQNLKVVSSKSRKQKKDKNWLQTLEVNKEDMQIIQSVKNKLLEYSGNICYFIIWPPMVDRFDEIEKKMSEDLDIIFSSTFEIGDMEEFIERVYMNQDYWRIDLKKHQLSNYNSKIRLMKVKPDLPNLPRPEDKLSSISDIKDSIRDKYTNEVESDYLIIHGTETIYENLRTLHSLSPYLQCDKPFKSEIFPYYFSDYSFARNKMNVLNIRNAL